MAVDFRTTRCSACRSRWPSTRPRWRCTPTFASATIARGCAIRSPSAGRSDVLRNPARTVRLSRSLERNIMDPETAEVLAVLDAAGQEPFAVNIHHDECGRTEFFEL